MIFKFNDTRILGFMGTTIVPGFNEVSSDVWAAMCAHPIVSLKMESGVIEAVDESEDQSASATFLLMKPAAVKRLIDNTHSLEQLSTWYKAETRDSIRDLIKARIDKISVVEYRDGTKETLKVDLGETQTDLEDEFGLDADEVEAPKQPAPKPKSVRKGSK